MSEMYSLKEESFFKLFKQKIYELQTEVRLLKDQQGDDSYVFRKERYVQQLSNENKHLRVELERLDKLYKNHRSNVSTLKEQRDDAQNQCKIYLSKIAQLKNHNILMIANINKLAVRAKDLIDKSPNIDPHNILKLIREILEENTEEYNEKHLQLSIFNIPKMNKVRLNEIQSDIKLPKGLQDMTYSKLSQKLKSKKRLKSIETPNSVQE